MPEIRKVKREDGNDTIYEVWQGRKLFWRRIVNNKSPAAGQWHSVHQTKQEVMAKAAAVES